MTDKALVPAAVAVMATASTFDQIRLAGRQVVPFLGLESYGLVLYCGSLSESESADLEASRWKPNSTDICPHRLKRSRRKLISLTVCDENGKRLMSEEQASNIDSKLADILYAQAYARTHFDKSKNLPAASEDDEPSDSRPSADVGTSTD